MQPRMSSSRILKWVSVVVCLSSQAQAEEPSPSARSRSQPCQRQQPERIVWPQGTHLWGTQRQVEKDETSSVLMSVSLEKLRLSGGEKKHVRLDGGRLSVPGLPAQGLVGAVLEGTSSEAEPVEVAICGAEPSAEDERMVWYHVQIWNAESATWENPCVATSRMLNPRALAVAGVWNESGARQELPGRFTFACENGAIAKCANWGYRPWASKDGRPLTELHQACTRMARADYCGDGRSHTHQNTFIDMYDSLEVLTPATQAVAGWDPTKASFEAAWGPDGAQCVARTRDGRKLESVLASCPGRFEPVAEELGQGDRCTHRRKGADSKAALLRNRSYQ